MDRIDIYPYGGCSKFDVDINVPIWQEFLVLVMGPLFQIVFVFCLRYFIDYDNLLLFERYSSWILCFNLLPIFPLDGGRFIQLVLCRFISYYTSCKITLYLSYFLVFSGLLFISLFEPGLILILIFMFLFINLIKELKKSSYYYYKFILERYMKDYCFRKIISIKDIKKMKRDTIHIIDGVPERDYLDQYFKIS